MSGNKMENRRIWYWRCVIWFLSKIFNCPKISLFQWCIILWCFLRLIFSLPLVFVCWHTELLCYVCLGEECEQPLDELPVGTCQENELCGFINVTVNLGPRKQYGQTFYHVYLMLHHTTSLGIWLHVLTLKPGLFGWNTLLY